jgi:hypothetical protein
MNIPEYLQQVTFPRRVDYEWDRRIANGFQANPADDHPKLFDALHLISIKAAYALGVACSEWAAARLQALADVTDVLLRIEAAWAASIDWRYADLPKPEAPRNPTPDPVAEPLWLTALFLRYQHQFLVETYQGVPNKGVRGSALRLALLVRHIAGKKSGFDKWLQASLRNAAERYGATDVPIDLEMPVPREFFYPGFIWSEEAVRVSQERLLQSLDPAKNPYLRKPAAMRKDGFEGEPYPQLRKPR